MTQIIRITGAPVTHGRPSILGRLLGIDNSAIGSKKKTYDVYFDNDYNSNSKGFKESLKFCKNYIKTWNGSNNSYFKEYKGGTVSIRDNNGELVYSTKVK